MKKTILSLILSITALVFVLSIYSTETSFDAVFTNSVTVEDVLIEDEAVALSSTPNTASYSPEEKSAPLAAGIKEKKSSKTRQ